jgi:hypothetical protein
MRAWLARRDQSESNQDLGPNDVRVILGLAPFLLSPAYLTLLYMPRRAGTDVASDALFALRREGDLHRVLPTAIGAPTPLGRGVDRDQRPMA